MGNKNNHVGYNIKPNSNSMCFAIVKELSDCRIALNRLISDIS